MPEVVTKGYKFVIIYYRNEILFNIKFTKGKKYSMTKSRRIKSISAVIALVLMLTSMLSVNAAAKSLEYSASSSYKSSSFYKNLSKVELTGDQVTDLVNVAKSQVGYHEGALSGYGSGSSNITEYGRWYGNNGTYWCNVFVSWCAYVAGVPSNVFPKLSGVGNAYYSTLPSVGAECFRFSSSRSLEAGDLIFSCTCSASYGCIDHVGLVVDVDENTIYTVEGNMSDTVKACQYPASTGHSSYYNARINYVARPQYENRAEATDIELSEPDGIVSYGKNVYVIYDTAVSYPTAVELSEEMGGSLVTVDSEKELEAIASLVESGSLDRYFINEAEEDGVFAINSDGKVVSTKEYRRNTGFICEIDSDKAAPVNAAAFNGRRYEVYDINVSFEQAKALAEAKGGSLAVINNETEAMMISLLLKESDSYFTGAQGTEKELIKVFNGFAKNVEFNEDDNTVVLLNDGSRELSVAEENEEITYGFIVEYDDSEKHTLIYDANGGENAPIEKIANCGERVNITDFVPVKGNKTFLGWSYEPNSKKVDVKSGARIKLAEDTTLYAVWG